MNITINSSDLPNSASLLAKAMLKSNKQNKMENIQLVVKGFRFNQSQLENYCHFLGFNSDTVPVPFLFVATQPAQLFLLNQEAAKLTLRGIVHRYISFESFAAIKPTEEYSFSLTVTDQINIDKGFEFELTGELTSQRGQCVARYQSRYLIRTRQSTAPKRPQKNTQFASPTNLRHAIKTVITPKMSRRYANISGDYNPIHLCSLLSRLFGYKKPIAHGMFMVGQLMACLDAPVKKAAFEFNRPALLPKELLIVEGSNMLMITDESGKPVVSGYTEN